MVVGVVVEDLGGDSSGHVVAMVSAAGVVADEPGVGFGLELAGRGEPAPVKRRPPAFLEHDALEPFTDRVVVR